MNVLKFFIVLLSVGHAFSYQWQLPLVSNVFGSNMVLQREPQSAKIWGWTTDSKVTLSLYDSAMVKEDYTATTDQDGKWSVALNPKAAGGPYSILVKSSSAVANLTNVLFGDVYYCSGQSNMEFSLGTAFNGTTAATASNNPIYSNIRLLRVPTVDAPVDYDMYTPDPIVNDTLSWAVASRTVTISFSAVCWWNAMHMASALNYSIPIGLIGNYWGGTKIEKWMSPQLFNSSTTGCPSGQSSITGPSAIYNKMVFPFIPMAFRVMYWYQGESNVGANNYYRCVFPKFVADYRAKFENNFPLVFVQLAPNNETNSARPDFRAMQFDLYVNTISDSCLVSTTDLGDLDSPRTPLHSRIKEPVGYRAHLCTRKLVYGMQGTWNGPIPTCATLSNDEITMSFAQGTVANGLVLREPTCPYDDERLDTICGRSWEISDGTAWHNATYRLSDDRMQLILTSSFVFPSNASIIQLRYAFGEYPVATLFNSEGVAAPTFVVGLSSCPVEQPTSSPVVGTVPQSSTSPSAVPEASTPRAAQSDANISATRVLAVIVASIMIL